MATPAHRSASPFLLADTGGEQTALPLGLSPARRRPERRRTGPCTVSYRLVAARAGARVLRPPTWLRAVRASTALTALRADRARTVLDVAGVLALAARADSTAAPTWPELIDRSGYSRATVARALAWLRTHQLLVTLENGSTEQFRPKSRPRRDRPAPVEVEGNRAAVYLLTEPLPDVDQVDQVDQGPDQSEHKASSQFSTLALTLETPRGSLEPPLVDQPRTGARKATTPPSGSTPKPAQRPAGRRSRHHSETSVPGYRRGGVDGSRGTRGQQRAEDLALAQALRTRSLDLRPVSPEAIRSVVRPFLAAGWTVEDLVWAIDHDVDGRARTFTAGPAAASTAQPADVLAERRRRVQVDDGAPTARAVASPTAWLAWRLAAWVGPAGLLPAPVQARRAASLAEQAAARAAAIERRKAAAASTTAATPPPPAFLEARRALRRRGGGGRRTTP